MEPKDISEKKNLLVQMEDSDAGQYLLRKEFKLGRIMVILSTTEKDSPNTFYGVSSIPEMDLSDEILYRVAKVESEAAFNTAFNEYTEAKLARGNRRNSK